MPDTITNRNYSVFHFRDLDDNESKIIKFESVSIRYAEFWLELNGITHYKLLYYCDNKGDIIYKSKNYKP